MNEKQARRLRKSLRQQGIEPTEKVYVAEKDVLSNNPNPKLSVDPSIFGPQTVLLHKECGRAAYQGLKVALAAF